MIGNLLVPFILMNERCDVLRDVINLITLLRKIRKSDFDIVEVCSQIYEIFTLMHVRIRDSLSLDSHSLKIFSNFSEV